MCRQDTVTLTPQDGAKYRQPLVFGSAEHTSLYYRLRSTQEGFHGIAKNPAAAALDIPGRRRVRGWAAQQFFTAILLAETATQRITQFLTDALTDRNGDLYIERLKYATNDTDHDPDGGPDLDTTPGPPGAPPLIETDAA